MEIAVFGGTFDPPTLAHEAIIGAALRREDLDEVWIMPSGCRTDKPGMQSDERRLGMLMLMKTTTFGDDPRLRISDFELNLPKPTQTYLTFNALRQSFPEHHFRFIFGVDSYQDMPNWDYGEQLQEEVDVLIVGRAGYYKPSISEKVDYLDSVPAEEMELSSSEVRQCLALGRCISGMVSPAIRNYLEHDSLYALYNH